MNRSSSIVAAAVLCCTPVLAQGGNDCSVPTPINANGTYTFDTTVATTSGFDGGGACAAGASSINQDLFWVFTAPTAGTYQFDTDGSSYDTKISVHMGGGCSATCLAYDDDGGIGLQSRVVIPSVSAGAILLVQVGGFGTGNGFGQLNIGPDACSAGVDDSFEDNDTCPTAVTMAVGTYTGLFTSLTDGDFYRVTVQPNDILTATTSNATPAFLDARIYDANCNVLADPGFGTVSYTNFGTTPIDLIVEVAVDPTSIDTCANYDLDLQVMVDPCTTFMPDSFEDNDDCPGAVPIGDGFYPALTVFDADNDFYAIGLDAGATLTADIFFIDAQADVDIYLWDPLVGCDTNVVGTGGPYITRGFSASDNEQISYTNATGSAQSLIIEVDMFTITGCNEYDLQLVGTNGSGGGFGMNYCMANPNSTGALGEISGSGSRTATNNDVTLTASSLPPLSFGFFITSQQSGFVPNPAGSAGNLCVSGAVGRYVGPGQIMNSGTAGQIVLPIDLTNTPQPNGFVSIASGETWYFQLWHRDSSGGMPTSNFTDGLQVDFL